MNPTIIKIDNNKVQVSINTVKAITYQYEEITAKKAQLLVQKQNIDDQLAEIDSLLAQCLVLGVKEKVAAANNVSAVADFVAK